MEYISYSNNYILLDNKAWTYITNETFPSNAYFMYFVLRKKYLDSVSNQ